MASLEGDYAVAGTYGANVARLLGTYHADGEGNIEGTAVINLPGGGSARVIVLCGALVGSCSELVQRFFPDLDPAIRDVIINICGTALGLAISTVGVPMHRQRRVPVEY